MVQIVENWSLVEGLVERWQPASSASPAILTLRVERVLPVEQSTGSFYPNFLEGREGSSIRIVLPEQLTDAIATGAQATVRIRRGRASDLFFAHPDGVAVITR